MVDAMLEVLPDAVVHHLGMYRSKDSLLPILYYNKLPKEHETDVAYVLEPLIATSGTLVAVCDILKTWKVPKIKVIALLAARAGLAAFHARHPDVQVLVCAVDDGLTPHGFIVPGVGDVGDRQFGTAKHHELEKMAGTSPASPQRKRARPRTESFEHGT